LLEFAGGLNTAACLPLALGSIIIIAIIVAS
jgi:hypothetical protein